ncbi:hypothetical protein D3C86_2025130 [compost metagenome]
MPLGQLLGELQPEKARPDVVREAPVPDDLVLVSIDPHSAQFITPARSGAASRVLPDSTDFTITWWSVN